MIIFSDVSIDILARNKCSLLTSLPIYIYIYIYIYVYIYICNINRLTIKLLTLPLPTSKDGFLNRSFFFLKINMIGLQLLRYNFENFRRYKKESTLYARIIKSIRKVLLLKCFP